MTSSASIWGPPPATVVAPAAEVHVWRAFLDAPASHVRYLKTLLSEDEQQRSENYYFDDDRRRFIAARGMLRTIISRYIELTPRHIRFTYGPHGKPALVNVQNRPGLTFNVSHSDELALYAITCNSSVGIDVERIRDDLELVQLARQFFSPREYAILRSLPSTMKPAVFFNCWTRKEAFVKAIGEGLTYPLDTFDVSLTPWAPARLIHVRDNQEEARHWSLHAISPAPEYAAALVVEGNGWPLRYWTSTLRR